MTLPSLEPLRGFLKGARGRSQEEIIVEFLDAVINVDDSADHGSVLINHPRKEKLVVFNEGDFLFTRRLLDPTKRAEWPNEFGYFDGIAGRCFRHEETKVFDRERAGSDFFGNSPIQNMICVPI